MNKLYHHLLLGFVGYVVTFAIASAQGVDTGAVTGRIYNPATDEYVRNAQVRIVSTNKVTVSEAGGYYRLADLPAGVVTVEVAYIGYQTITADVEIKAGVTTKHDFKLAAVVPEIDEEGKPVILEQYVVSTEREGSSKVIMEERASMNITNQIASEVFGDNAEGNIGEFLRNVPGVTLDTVGGEVRNVGLGGLGSEYTTVTVDGVSLAGADANAATTRAITFEQVSLSSMDSVEVARTISADVDADAAGGTINLRTKRAFDRGGRRIIWQANTALHSSALNLNKTYGPFDDRKSLKARPGGIFEYSNVFLDRRLGIVLNVSESNLFQAVNRVVVDYNRTTTTADPRPQVPSRLAFQQQMRFNKRFATTLTTDYRASEELVLSLSAIYNYSQLWNPQRAVYFRPGARTTVIGDRPEFSYTTNSSAASVGLNPTNVSKMGESITLTPKFSYRISDLQVEGVFSYSNSTSEYETMARQGAIRSMGEPTATGVNYEARRSSDPTSTDWTVRQISGPDISNGASFSKPAVLVNDDRFARGQFLTGQLNATLLTHRVLPIEWKAGIKTREERRDFDDKLGMQRYNYVGASNWSAFRSPWEYDLGSIGESITSISGGSIFIPDLAALGKQYQEHPEYFTDASTVTDYYNSFVANKRKFKERIDSGFLMATGTLGRLLMRVGVRREDTSTDVEEPNARSSNEVKAAGYAVSTSTGLATTRDGINYQFLSQPRVHRRTDYHKYYPSASAKYKLKQNMDLSLGFSSTIRRPSYGDVAGVWVANDNTGRVSAPNVNLRPETAKNFATRLAYFFKNVGQLSVSAYQNNVKNLIEASELTAEEFGYTGSQYADYVFVTRRNAESDVTVRSFEFGYSQNLGVLGSAFNGLSVRANYTRAYADFIKVGLMPHAINGGFNYSRGRLNLNANANWTDSWPSSSTGLSFRRHRTQVDAGIGWKLRHNLTLLVSGRNVLNARYVQMQEVAPSPATATDILDVGASYIVAIKGNF